MFQKALGGLVLGMVVAALAGCGFSEAKAKARCDQEQASKSQCVTEAAHAQCVDCYMQCGDACEAQAVCPEAYRCDGASADDTSAGDTSTEQ